MQENSPWRFNLALFLLFLVSVTRNEKLNWEIYSLKNGLGLHQALSSTCTQYPVTHRHKHTILSKLSKTWFLGNHVSKEFLFFFSSFSFHFLICESIITHLQETWKIQNKITYSSTIFKVSHFYQHTYGRFFLN